MYPPASDSVRQDVEERAAQPRATPETRRARQRAVLVSLGQRAIRARHVDELFEEAAVAVAAGLGVPLSIVAELLEGGGGFVLRAGVGWRRGTIGRRIRGTRGPGWYALEVGEAVLVEDVRTETRFAMPRLLLEHGVVSTMAVIITGRARHWGILAVHAADRRRFTAEEEAFLQSVASLLALAVECHQAEDSRERLPSWSQRGPDIAAPASARAADPLAALTPRQREILRLVAEGLTSKQIATLLEISHRTVESHRSDIMERLEVRDLAGLVRLAVRAGLVGGGT